MKTAILLIVFAALAGTAYSQLTVLPPPCTADGVFMVPLVGCQNAGGTHWEANPGLASYRFASDANLAMPKPGDPDNALGLYWDFSSPAVTANLNSIIDRGGTIRVMFLGESAGWLNDFGYSYIGGPCSQNPASAWTAASYTIYRRIQALGGTPFPVNIAFGDSIDISFGKRAATSFDFWYHGAGAIPLATQDPTTAGGVYMVFHPKNSRPFVAPGNVMMTTEALPVSTWSVTTPGIYYQYVDTYLVAIEDWRLDRGSDRDYNDFMFAPQFFPPDGTPDFAKAVPESAITGIVSLGAMAGLLALKCAMEARRPGKEATGPR